MSTRKSNFASDKTDITMKKALLFITILHSVAVYAQTESSDTVSAQQLNEVVVRGEKPQVRGEDGVLIVDLPAIVKDKPVTNILEALGYIPGRDGRRCLSEVWFCRACRTAIETLKIH